MKIHATGLLIVLLITFCSIISCSTERSKNISINNAKNVVFISSFHDNHVWTKNVRNSIVHTFEENDVLVNHKNIYLDAKNIQSPYVHRRLIRSYVRGIKNKIDVIICSDLEASLQLVQNTDSNLRDVPVVFVSEWSKETPISKELCCGCIAKIGVEKTYNLAQQMFPLADSVLVLSDGTATGELYMELAKEQLKPYESMVHVQYGVEAKSVDELLKCISLLSNRTIVILCTWQQDDTGKYISPSILYPQIAKLSKAPIFSLVNNMMGCGIVGGYMLSPTNNGRVAAEKAIKILKNEKIALFDTIEPIPVFDKKALNRFSISEHILPDDAIVINDLKSFILSHKMVLLWLLISVFIVGLSTIILLIHKNRYKNLVAKEEQELKKMELDLKALSISMKTLNAYTWYYDVTSHKLFYGEGFSALGIDADQYNSSEKFDTLLHEEDRDLFHEVIASAIDNNKKDINIVYRFRLPNSSDWVWWECRGVLDYLITKHGKKQLVIYGIAFDIDNHKAYEHKLADALAKAEQSDKLKSAFLANISHEIRTPLNAIVGFSDLIAETDDPAEKEEYARMVRGNSDHLIKLVNDVLDLSKIEAGYIDIRPREINFADVFNDIYNSLKLMAEKKKNIDFIHSNPYDSCIICLDRSRITQVLTNLVTNAIKYTEKGTISMNYIRDGRGIKIWVSDTGIGISEENKKKVFGRFQKFDDFAQGTGLGLSICKAIIEAVGGRIWFESTIGKGTTFYAWIPDASVMQKDK